MLTTSRPQLKGLAISSLHHTSGPASHAHRLRPLPHVSSWKQHKERESHNQPHPLPTHPHPLIVPRPHPFPELRPSSAHSSPVTPPSEEPVVMETKIMEQHLSELSSCISSSPSVSQPSPSPLPSISLPSLSPYTPGPIPPSHSERCSEQEEEQEDGSVKEREAASEGREMVANEGEEMEEEEEVISKLLATPVRCWRWREEHQLKREGDQ